jgi:ABC-type nickel/cobalt efflux system permease component RcnA
MTLPLDLSGDLSQASLLSLAGAGFVAALLHAALPTHWLPFVAVGRAQGWRTATILGLAALAGLAHIASTAVIGSLLTLAGSSAPWINQMLPALSALVLFGFGLWYLARGLRQPRAASGEPEPERSRVPDATAAWGLVGFLAASPGEALLPVYVGAGVHGWGVVAVLTVVFAAGTMLGMVGFTALALAGVQRFRLQGLARFDGVALGFLLIGLGILVLILHRH